MKHKVSENSQGSETALEILDSLLKDSGQKTINENQILVILDALANADDVEVVARFPAVLAICARRGLSLNSQALFSRYWETSPKRQNLEKLLLDLRKKNIQKIRGDLIFDDFYFDSLYWGAGWMWDDASAWEFAPIHALSVNDNCVRVTVEPGATVGDSLLVSMTPETGYLTLENKGITVDSTDTLNIDRYRVERDWINHRNVILIQGGLPVAGESEEYDIDVLDGARYTATVFAELLVDNGIDFNGKIHRQRVPQNAKMIARFPSEPLSLVVHNINKISDNLSAEMLLKTIGAETKGVPGSAEKGISVIYSYLQSVGVDSLSYYLADGSGVSRYNVITPDLMIELLKDMDRDYAVQAEFAASLPIAGADGTLENRMKNGPAAMNLRAKTGTLRGVSTLSGYTTTADGEKLAFSIMIEHFVTRASNIRKIQDRIGELMSGFTRKVVLPVTDKTEFELNQSTSSSN